MPFITVYFSFSVAIFTCIVTCQHFFILHNHIIPVISLPYVKTKLPPPPPPARPPWKTAYRLLVSSVKQISHTELVHLFTLNIFIID